MIDLLIICEALSADTANWGQFFVDLLDDILDTAKLATKPNDILRELDGFSYIEKDSSPFVQKIVDRFYKELDAENVHIKIASICSLPYYLDNNSIRNKSSIVMKLQQQLYDQNWKVRVTTFKSLGFAKLLPDGYKLSFKDRLTKLILGEPTYI